MFMSVFVSVFFHIYVCLCFCASYRSVNLFYSNSVFYSYKPCHVLSIMMFRCTVKPELTATSEQRQPAYKGHHLKSPISIFIIQGTSEQRPPVNNDRNFRVLRVAVVHRFDCTLMKEQINFLKSKSNRFRRVAMVQWLRQMVHDQEVVGLNPGTIYWMDVSNYIREN